MEDVGKGANVVLVPVCEEDRKQALAAFQEIADVRYHQVDA